jgi:hypothetical protein
MWDNEKKEEDAATDGRLKTFGNPDKPKFLKQTILRYNR